MKSRNTLQKQVLEKAVSEYTQFFNAEDILKKVQEKNKHIGIATVYRFLKEMQKQGELHSYTCNRKTVYSNKLNSHSHYVCKKCRKITHIKIDDIAFIEKNIPGTICHFQIEVSGICKNCQK